MWLVILILSLIFHINYYLLTVKFQDFANNTSANIKLSKTQIAKLIKSGGFVSLLDMITT